jgi:hypothetical protein
LPGCYCIPICKRKCAKTAYRYQGTDKPLGVEIKERKAKEYERHCQGEQQPNHEQENESPIFNPEDGKFQFELNAMFEGSPFDLVKLMAKLFYVWACAFYYYSLYPLTIAFAMATVAIVYIICKIGMCRSWKKATRLESKLIFYCWGAVKFLPLWLGLSYCIFDHYLYNKVHAESWILLSLALFCPLINWEFCWGKHGTDEDIGKYSENKYRLISDYGRTEPLDGQRKQAEFMKFLCHEIEHNAGNYEERQLKGMKIFRGILSKQGDFINQFENMNVAYTKWNTDTWIYQLNEFWSQNGAYLMGYKVPGVKGQFPGILRCC